MDLIGDKNESKVPGREAHTECSSNHNPHIPTTGAATTSLVQTSSEPSPSFPSTPKESTKPWYIQWALPYSPQILQSPGSRLLFERYLSQTSNDLGITPVSKNPFVGYCIPLAFSTDLIMNCLLALAGADYCTKESADPATKSVAWSHYSLTVRGLRTHLSNNERRSVESTLHVLLITMGICMIELMSGAPTDKIFHHLLASRHLIHNILSSPTLLTDPDHVSLFGYLFELYSYRALGGSVHTQQQLNSPITHSLLDLGFFLGSFASTTQYPFYFSTLATRGHLLSAFTPSIASLLKARLSESDSDADEISTTYILYQNLASQLRAWQPPQAQPDVEFPPQKATAVIIYQNALLIYLHTTFLSPTSLTRPSAFAAAILTEIQIRIEICLPLLSSLYPSRMEGVLLWPALIIGSCLKREEERNILRAAKGRARYKLRTVVWVDEVLERLWRKSSEGGEWRGRYWGPRGLASVVEGGGEGCAVSTMNVLEIEVDGKQGFGEAHDLHFNKAACLVPQPLESTILIISSSIPQLSMTSIPNKATAHAMPSSRVTQIASCHMANVAPSASSLSLAVNADATIILPATPLRRTESSSQNSTVSPDQYRRLWKSMLIGNASRRGKLEELKAYASRLTSRTPRANSRERAQSLLKNDLESGKISVHQLLEVFDLVNVQSEVPLPNWDGFISFDATGATIRESVVEFAKIQWYQEHRSIATRILLHRFRPEHKYSPLKSRSNSLRLLDLSGKDGSHFTSCRMKEFQTEKCPPYSALSYVWGKLKGSIPFLIDSRKIDVTPNLFGALQVIHQKKLTKWLWVDALCINQADDEEKSNQVQEMRFIYRKAERVFAWFETHGDYGSSILTDLRSISEAIILKLPALNAPWIQTTPSLDSQRKVKHKPRHENELGINLDQFIEYLPSYTNLVDNIISEIFDTRLDYRAISTIEQFFEQSLWSRIWILQEFASAESLLLLRGQETLPLSQFLLIWAVLYCFAGNPKHWFPHGSILEDARAMAPLLLHSRILEKGQEQRSLLELLRATGRFQATDPRDKIFALLGLAKDAEQLEIRADYSKKYEEICVEVATKLIKGHGLSILSFASRTGAYNLPSWVPDWNLNTVHTLGNHDRAISGIELYAGKRHPISNEVYQISRSGHELEIPSFRVGKIDDIGEENMSWSPSGFKTLIERMWTQLEKLAIGRSQNKITIDDLDNAIFSIPIAYRKPRVLNGSEQHSLPPSDLFKSYQALRQIDSVAWLQSLRDSRFDVVQANVYISEFERRGHQKVPLISDQGHLGIGPLGSQPGDLIYIFPGASVPFILRRLANGNFTLLGEAYVYGIMYGEFFEQNPDIEVERIVLG
ncbi:uncharacterized protein PAC_07561 [Phialocephala subalpina]|uniref:Heterokaryon incompatibility domain-containing protein n=1 Tax=Phialocephala subalpina TaxID=576137 RepID=A0A1L7WY26_9HELO|nr:uncharacterized protein PAC_07561 [Phialocephala subalpina]